MRTLMISRFAEALWASECPLSGAASTGRCNTCVKSFRRRFKFQRLTWPLVEPTRYFVQLSLRVYRHVC